MRPWKTTESQKPRAPPPEGQPNSPVHLSRPAAKAENPKISPIRQVRNHAVRSSTAHSRRRGRAGASTKRAAITANQVQPSDRTTYRTTEPSAGTARLTTASTAYAAARKAINWAPWTRKRPVTMPICDHRPAGRRRSSRASVSRTSRRAPRAAARPARRQRMSVPGTRHGVASPRSAWNLPRVAAAFPAIEGVSRAASTQPRPSATAQSASSAPSVRSSAAAAASAASRAAIFRSSSRSRSSRACASLRPDSTSRMACRVSGSGSAGAAAVPPASCVFPALPVAWAICAEAGGATSCTAVSNAARNSAADRTGLVE